MCRAWARIRVAGIREDEAMNATEKDAVNKALAYVRHTPSCKIGGLSRLCTCGATDAVRAVGKLTQDKPTVKTDWATGGPTVDVETIGL